MTTATKCATPGCANSASLRCPTCVSLKLDTPDPSLASFCSQPCFKSYWPIHKQLHKLFQASSSTSASTSSTQTLEHQRLFKNFKFTGPLRAFPLSPPRTVPDYIPKPDYHLTGIPLSEQQSKKAGAIRQLSSTEIEGMRKVCRLAREVLDEAARAVKPGVTTDEIDRIVHEECIKRNSYPSPLNYYHFPKSCCTSVNEVICHGIPDTRPLEHGDIINIDVTLYHGGFHGDLNETYLVIDPSKLDSHPIPQATKDLIKCSHDAMHAAIDAVKPGVLFREFGAIIEKIVQERGCSVVRTYSGHGINQLFHTAPNVPHFKKNKAVGICKPGMAFTIEPMINQGSWKDITWPDNWTAVTEDGKLSAQFEHTLFVTETGVEILTARLPTSPKFWWEE